MDQNRIYPDVIWNADEFQRQFMSSLDESYAELSKEPEFSDKWKNWATVNGTKTMWRQTPLLGKGSSGRDVGGFWLFTVKYFEEEKLRNIPSAEPLDCRCSFERYQDFALYAGDSWYEGTKRHIVIAEVESNEAELLGELSGLLSIRCPIKYLFIAQTPDLFGRLTKFCGEPNSGATDWAGTTFFVAEIPDKPEPPSDWTTYRADVSQHGEKLCFRRVEKS